jgi:hypothetical protein
MKRILFAIVSSLFVSVSSLYAQSNGLLSWSPQFITDNNPSDVVITVDASKGNQGFKVPVLAIGNMYKQHGLVQLAVLYVHHWGAVNGNIHYQVICVLSLVWSIQRRPF